VTVLVEILGALAVVWAASVAFGLVWLRRRNRVSPKVRSRAPLAWMASPGRAAAAHRRLRRAVQGVHAAATLPNVASGELSACIADVERQAAAIDDHLVLAARCSPVVRRSLVRGLEGQVREIERVSARITTLVLGGHHPSGEWGADALRRISERLDALDAANAELAALEATYASPSWDPTRASGPHG
jgi:hypothetical protein